jgi:hypothetical protein
MNRASTDAVPGSVDRLELDFVKAGLVRGETSAVKMPVWIRAGRTITLA